MSPPTPQEEIALIKSLLDSAFKRSSTDDFIHKKLHDTHVFAFPARWSVSDFYSGEKLDFCQTKIDLTLFPSMKVLGTGDAAVVNQAFLERFKSLKPKLEKSLKLKGKEKIIFTGFSSGGAIAILATIWFLEHHRPKGVVEFSPRCVTFGAPLVGDRSFGHALRREPLRFGEPDTDSWSSCFMNIVFAGDLAPSMLFSPLKEIKHFLEIVVGYWKASTEKKSASLDDESCSEFFKNVVSDACVVASHESPVLRTSANGKALVDAVKSLVELSPYRPFGTYLFFCGEGKKAIEVVNHDAVLQILFYSLRLPEEFAKQIIRMHGGYESKLKDWLKRGINWVDLTDLSQVKLPSDDDPVNQALVDLGLASAEAKLSLMAARENEEARLRNAERVDGYRTDGIKTPLEKIKTYRKNRKAPKGYYDSFKDSANEARDYGEERAPDFEANVDRLELVGYWEEVRELLKEFELPDWFELRSEWLELGTEIRYLVEPIDIANFYRHGKKDATGLYETQSPARPKYYKYPENWLAHVQKFLPEDHDPLGRNRKSLDSTFWARVENLCIKKEKDGMEGIKNEVEEFLQQILVWIDRNELDREELKGSPTFKNWWKKCLDEKQQKKFPLSSKSPPHEP